MRKKIRAMTSISKDTLDKIDAYAQKEGRTRSDVIKRIVENYFREKESTRN
jgi:metal-responsive CopG/Arc/MetJ family transcriptional regulator